MNNLIDQLKDIERRIEALELAKVGSQSSDVPIGSLLAFSSVTAPTGFLICDGSAVSRTTYSDLFMVIGTDYGVGDGSTTFNLPDIQGKVITGYNSSDSSFSTMGQTGGAKTHTLTTAELPSHRHWISSADRDDANMTGTGSNTQNYGLFADAGSYSANDPNRSTGRYTAYTGSTNAHNNLQPYITMTYIIKT